MPTPCSLAGTWASETNQEHTVSHSFHSRNLLSIILSGAGGVMGKQSVPAPASPQPAEQMAGLGQGSRELCIPQGSGDLVEEGQSLGRWEGPSR